MRRLFLRDLVDFVALATKSLEEDNFTRCFEPISPFEMEQSGIFYIFSFIIRYTFLFPLRFMILFLSTVLFIIMNPLFLFLKLKTESLFYFYSKALLLSFGAKIHHHGIKKRLSVPHLYVANHTSFVDYIVLSSYKFSHACIAENHGGLFGFLLNMLKRNNGSIGFKRSEKRDKEAVLTKMRKHVYNIDSVPMMVFPEGTCVNNKYTVLFQKGAFDLDCAVVPVAIKYRRNLMDPYWNRRKYGFTEQLFYLLTRWRLEADVWWMEERWRGDAYLKCMQQICEPDGSMHECICEQIDRNNEIGIEGPYIIDDDIIPEFRHKIAAFETPSEFSMRIKEIISEKGGLKSVLWNGYFKSSPVLRDREILREAYRNVFKNRNNLKVPRKEKIRGEHRFCKNTDSNPPENLKLDLSICDSRNLLCLKDTLPKNFTDKNNKNKKMGSTKKITQTRAIYRTAISKFTDNDENNYFNCFTYKEYLEHVLNEYLNIKRGQKFNKRMDGLWWGHAGNFPSKECSCESREQVDCQKEVCENNAKSAN